MNAPLRAFGRSPETLDRLEHDIHEALVRSVKRERVRSLVRDARSALRRLCDRGIYSEECWAYEAEVDATHEAAIEAFRERHE